MKVLLKDLVQVRCGDKGNDSDINIFAPNNQIYSILEEELTEDKVRTFYGDLVKGEVIRYEVPNVLALKFHLKEALGGGGPSSLRLDNLGKTMGAIILRMEVDIDEEIINKDFLVNSQSN
ncbi:hypothetical protein [Lysinibacillus yapensis]|nr:hypothetical protein [Lysinibacillus yapensis]